MLRQLVSLATCRLLLKVTKESFRRRQTGRTRASLRHRTADPIAAAERSNLLVEVDLALDLKRETDPAEC